SCAFRMIPRVSGRRQPRAPGQVPPVRLRHSGPREIPAPKPVGKGHCPPALEYGGRAAAQRYAYAPGVNRRMHIKDLWKLRHHDQHLPTETSPAVGFKLPVAVELVLETPVVRGQQMIDGVKSIKGT